jgi:hypothetical protein
MNELRLSKWAEIRQWIEAQIEAEHSPERIESETLATATIEHFQLKPADHFDALALVIGELSVQGRLAPLGEVMPTTGEC